MSQLDAFEEAARVAVLDRHERRNPQVARLREAMAEAYWWRRRSMGDEAYVSGNDVRRYLERYPEHDRPGSANWRAAVWNSPMWEKRQQQIPSTAPGGKATPVNTYRLRADWLAERQP